MLTTSLEEQLRGDGVVRCPAPPIYDNVLYHTVVLL